MKLVKGQEFVVPHLGPTITVPVTLVEESSHQELVSEPPESFAIYGSWVQPNPFSPKKTHTTTKYKTVVVETKTDILILVDRATAISVCCLEVGHAGNLHKLGVIKEKQKPFICYATNESLRRLVE